MAVPSGSRDKVPCKTKLLGTLEVEGALGSGDDATKDRDLDVGDAHMPDVVVYSAGEDLMIIMSPMNELQLAEESLIDD